MGVQQRVENLADRPAVGLEASVDCRSLVPLPELVGEVLGVGPASKAVTRTVDAMIERLGPELPILERLPVDAVQDSGFPEVADAIDLVRRGQVLRDPGFDGEYGAIHLARSTEPQPIASLPEAAGD
jgi:PHP family Zn ribbon phosphoesterase